jgi:dTDP-glucose 4,6-dehydratase
MIASYPDLGPLSGQTILVTGGAGFIGSNFIHSWLEAGGGSVVNLDSLTYAGNPDNVASLSKDPRYSFAHGDVGDRQFVDGLLSEHRPIAILHFAAESHVDRSIEGPGSFIGTNIVGTFRLLESAHAYWSRLRGDMRDNFRFLHVSTDEVFGSLPDNAEGADESSPFRPNSPYAASKASSDHLVRAWFHTYKLPVVTTNCSNNYGPRQFPEKLIPLIIHNALSGKPLPIYGDGLHVRDWIYVNDHCSAIATVLLSGAVGECYNIGGNSEMRNIDVVRAICSALDKASAHGLLRQRGTATDPATANYSDLIAFVKDRPGHDRRYAIDSAKIQRQLGWRPAETFETGIRKTVHWYLSNPDWVANIQNGAYRDWIKRQYGE